MPEIYINSDPVTTWYLVLNMTFLNHNDVLIIGTYFFLKKGTRENYHRYQNGIKNKRVSDFECLYYISIDLDQMITS